MNRVKSDNELNTIALKVVDIAGIAETLKSACVKVIYRYNKGTPLNLSEIERNLLLKANYGEMIISDRTDRWLL
jgi:hypothetical protein